MFCVYFIDKKEQIEKKRTNKQNTLPILNRSKYRSDKISAEIAKVLREVFLQFPKYQMLWQIDANYYEMSWWPCEIKLQRKVKERGQVMAAHLTLSLTYLFSLSPCIYILYYFSINRLSLSDPSPSLTVSIYIIIYYIYKYLRTSL